MSRGNNPDNPRLQRLNKLLHSISCGQAILSPRNGSQFLEAIFSQPDPAACISRLIGSRQGLLSIQAVMRFDLRTEFLNGHASNFILYLRAPVLQQIGGGSFLQQILDAVVDPPIFWNAFVEEFRQGRLQGEGELAFAWLLRQLVMLPVEKAGPYREVAQDPAVLDRLLSASQPELVAIGQKIKDILSTFNPAIPDDIGFTPGGRHDNDFADFRSISVLPTADEITSKERAFLRPRAFLEDPETHEHRIATYLDNQYRLLREDMIYEMRDEIRIIFGEKKGKHRGVVIDSLKLLGVNCGPEGKRVRWGLRFECGHDLWPLSKKKTLKGRKAILQDEGRNLLRHQSLTCLMVGREIVAFPSVMRDEDLLAQNPPIILLSFTNEASLKKALLKLKNAKQIQLVQINTAVFAYEPVLRALQETISVPLAPEILSWTDDSDLFPPPLYPEAIIESLREDPHQDLRALLNIKQAKPIRLDVSQSTSLLSALTQRVSLIQGPPGTGKSFIGALHAKILHESTAAKILVVCYTNHALDQFLEDLLDIGLPEDCMVRLGSQSTSRTAPLSLQSQKRAFKMTRTDWDCVNKFRSSTEILAKALEHEFVQYGHPVPNYRDVLEYLEFEEPTYHEAFTIPVEDGDMKRVDRQGNQIKPHYLLHQWVKGWNAGIFKDSPHVQKSADIWAMSYEARQSLYSRWSFEILKQQADLICNITGQYGDALNSIDRIFDQNTVAVLKSKRIIGCTTTAAAKYRLPIQAASPDVVLVEEAGEILESHVLTSLGPETKHLVLIGDHRQLRPKVNNYFLTVEKGNGYDLNMSMFERLVRSGYPHSTLSQQHRMRPEISSLVRRLTYPDLVDADDTLNRPNLRGLQDNIVFISHASPEDDNAHLRDNARDVFATSSKRNMFEAEMTLKTVKYLGQQGYGTDKIVILTPYLGQMFLLREMLKKDNDPVLNDLDSYDLVHAGLVTEAAANISKQAIRLATIDNYQGEESEIVICCLTRSNSDHEIGFMSSPERLNVLLSRARDGLILMGNAETFMGARRGKELWTQLFDLLKGGRHIYDGLPVKCERHPHRLATLRNPADFDNLAPDGGCQEPCGTILSCRIHTCPSKCHQLSDHSKMLCEKVISDICSNGHPLSWKCHKDRPTQCKQCDKEAKAAEKLRQKQFAEQQRREAEEQEHARQLARLEEEIEKQTQLIRDRQIAADRANALRQKEADLAAISSLAAQRTTGPASQGDLSAGSENGQNAPNINNVAPDSSSQPSEGDVKEDGPPLSETPMSTSSETDALAIEPSPSEKEWERQKSVEGVSNTSIDAIMAMTGLEDVKAQVLEIKDKIDVTQRQGTSLTDERFNIVLLGNPGTGKTTIARHYAKFLASVQVLPGIAFIETTGSRLANDGVPGAKKQIEEILNAGGGALFIDEAYQLTGSHNFQGGQVLDFLLAEMENNVGKIVFILAGYSKQMEKFFEHNPGLPSRVPYTLRFADYTNVELRLMFERMLKKKYDRRMKIENGYQGLFVRIAIRRLGRGRGREGFGNARALENLKAKVTGRQARRLAIERKQGRRPDDFLLTKEDLIGPDPSQVTHSSAAWKELSGLIGLEAVKNSVRSMLESITLNYKRELAEKEPVQVSLNRVFLGSPGTGKTTVAKLYGQILADLSLLSDGEVVVKNPADFIGSVLGESESKTKAILAATVGKTLVIDEAYMLYGGGTKGAGQHTDIYKTAVIDTIVAEVQSTPGEDRCVLLLGYREQIEDMFQNVNPGLARRFAIEDAFHFDDFDDSDLRKILDLKLKKQNLGATDHAKHVAIAVLSRLRNRPNFGNAGEVENLLGQAKGRYQLRLTSVPVNQRPFDIVFEPQDFDPNFDRDARASANLRDLFRDVVGCDNIVTKLSGYQETARKMKARDMDPRGQIPTNFVMKGPPGTGKTTTARKLGQVFYDMGFLSSSEVVECSASDLVGQYVGHTGPKTKALLEKALGRVLFVDEAYRLGDGPFAKEAIDELVSVLTQPKFHQKVVVVLAGYDADMNRLMAINSGLSSRFSEELVFTHMSPQHCLQILKAQLTAKKVQLKALEHSSSSGYQSMVRLLEQLSAFPSWGNARDVGTLAKQMISLVFTRPSDESDDSSELTLTTDEAIGCMETMLAERRARTAHVSKLPQVQLDMPSASAPPPPTAAPSISTTHTTRQPSPERNAQHKAPPPDDAAEERDPGVPDHIWQKLQEDKLAAELANKRLTEELVRMTRELEETKRKEAEERERIRQLEETRARDAAEEDKRKRKLEAARLRELAAREKRAREEAARRAMMEAEAQRRKQEAKAQAALRQMGVCVAGYRWIKQEGGYRCAGGSHFVSDGALGI
ncbi:uncharacterized protein FIBRA_08761 [Fibroporia radiculosa]|uniref:AAA+ ATPase domain-containing protein n=1 Tax=Fibroporia radiculosa TaxID=599839 RepID=J4I3A4_9APHY|nr:uncharacterized protein FIBRA_08761 [Fibroporia radiculosa]CCM06492.1 predicted protein [Fibroporia radiculosa]